MNALLCAFSSIEMLDVLWKAIKSDTKLLLAFFLSILSQPTGELLNSALDCVCVLNNHQ